jgi:hypothetical protein
MKSLKSPVEQIAFSEVQVDGGGHNRETQSQLDPQC